MLHNSRIAKYHIAHPYMACVHFYLFIILSEIGSDVSLMISQYPYGPSSSRVFDPTLGLHDAFLVVDNYIFVQVCTTLFLCVCMDVLSH